MKILLTFLLAFTLSSASVKIYKNKTELTYTPISKFIGFNQNMSASNKDGDIKLINSSCIGSKNSTCRDINKINKLTNINNELLREKKVMSNLLNNFYSDYKSAKVNMDYISQMSTAITKLEEKISKNNNEISEIKQTKYFHSLTPVYLDKLYKKDIKLNFSGISFYSKYVLNIDTAKLNHSLHVKNRSGVDITKTTAYIFDRNFYSTTPNTAFRPSTVSKVQPRVYKKRNMSKTVMPVMEMAMDADSSFVATPVVNKTETKSYTIKNFALKSDNIEKKFVVDSKKVNIKKETIWRAWQDGVFVQGSFPIVDTLEVNRIDIIYKNALSKDNFIRVQNNNQIFNITQDYDIKTKKKYVPTYTQSKGLFNSDTMTKKTIKLQVTNMSSKIKKLTIYDKIPVSTDEDIKVVLNHFKDSKNRDVKIDYNKTNGKIILHVELKPKKFEEFTYEYTIRHPKEIKVFVRN